VIPGLFVLQRISPYRKKKPRRKERKKERPLKTLMYMYGTLHFVSPFETAICERRVNFSTF